jgi:DNA-binding PadR family transcriptional regulator
MADEAPKLLRGLLEVFLLESLEQAPKHGYALLKEMGDTFGAQPNRNRLYPLLAKLVTDGYVREVSEAGGNRTLYALTERGHEALRAYRRLPPQFRRALRRIWTDETHAVEGAREGAGMGTGGVEGQGEGKGEGTVARVVPVIAADDEEAPARGGGEPPYPCEDARVAIEKDPRSGDLAVRVTGCPMGSFPYCPQCPIHKAVQGLRAVVFSP